MKITLRNTDIEFITGIKLTGYSGDPDLIQVWSSRSINSSKWEPIGSYCECLDSEIYVLFHKPTNSHDFLVEMPVDTSEKVINDVTASFILAEKHSSQSIEARLKQKSIAFVGCAKNIREQAINTMIGLEVIKKYFKSTVIGVFENDSTDGTDLALQELHEKRIIQLIQKKNLDALIPQRTARLSYGRNLLLKWALMHEIDYLCVLDFDTPLSEGVLIDGFLNNFTLESTWDAVFPINKHFYYDIYALRHPDFFNFDFNSRLQHADAALGPNNSLWLHAFSRQINLKDLASWLPVDSAFGGVGIYKVDKLRQSNASYRGLDHEGNEICEHLAFHATLKQHGAQLYINPNFVVGPLSDDYPKNVFPNGIWSSS
jgi:hypothetical protein